MPMRYLEITLGRGRMSRREWNPLIDKIKKKIRGIASMVPIHRRAPGVAKLCLIGHAYLSRVHDNPSEVGS